MTDQRLAYHEASHCVAAVALGLPVTYVSVRPHGDSDGRARFDIDSEALGKLDALSCAIIQRGGRSRRADARRCDLVGGGAVQLADRGWRCRRCAPLIAQMDGDELDNRHWATVRAYALLRTRWEAVEAIAAKLQRNTTVLGEEVSKICMAEAARRSARSQAAERLSQPARHGHRASGRTRNGDRSPSEL